MIRTKRLLYVPGLISLVGLFIALPYFYRTNKPTKQGVLSLFVPKDCNKDHGMNDYSKCYLEKELRNKKQIRITINENHKENRKKLDIIRHEALKLKYFEDTSTVILMTLSDSISYGEFVSIVDMCETDGHKRYGSWDNKFVIWGEWPPKKRDTSNLLRTWANDVIEINKPVIKAGLFESLEKKINKYYTTKGLCLLLGWIVLLISFLFFRKKLVLQKH